MSKESLLHFCLSTVGWSVIFLALGAPLLPFFRFLETAVLAALVTISCPLSFYDICSEIAASAEREKESSSSYVFSILDLLSPAFPVQSSVTLSETMQRTAMDTESLPAKDDTSTSASVRHRLSRPEVVQQSMIPNSVPLTAASSEAQGSGYHNHLPVKERSTARERSTAFGQVFLLALALLVGAIFGQLDWQGTYQMWPYPSALSYILVRGLLWVGRRR